MTEDINSRLSVVETHIIYMRDELRDVLGKMDLVLAKDQRRQALSDWAKWWSSAVPGAITAGIIALASAFWHKASP